MSDATPTASPAAGRGMGYYDFDPVSRVAGALSFHATIDLDRGGVQSGTAMARIHRGYENLLTGRDVRDAVFISSRACGVCGSAHSICSAMACEMAFGIQPPPMAIAARNLMSALEHLADHPQQLFVRSGPDYSAPAVKATSPALWQRAETTLAPGYATHGFKRIANIMGALTLGEGALYREALEMSRIAREAFVTIGGKYPHPQTIRPGSVSATIDRTDLNLLLMRVVKFHDYAKRVVAVWDDIVDFFCESDPAYLELGMGPRNFLDLGLWDDPLEYDAAFESSGFWGERRWATPGAIVNGRLVTTALPEINAGVEEFVEHSFYQEWRADLGGAVDPMGNSLGANHPSGKQTIAAPGESDMARKYSWSTAPRWRRNPMETGAVARLWTTAMAGKLPHRRFIEPTGESLRLAMPQAGLPAAELEWRVPARWGTLERTRGLAYALAFSTLVAFEHTLIGLDFSRTGETAISTPFKVPRGTHSGIGFWGGSRGYLSHHLTADRGVIQNYQILTGSTWTMSPRDSTGQPGPCEQAVVGAPGYIDILRTIRSFDPCMPCAAH